MNEFRRLRIADIFKAARRKPSRVKPGASPLAWLNPSLPAPKRSH